MTGGSMWKDEVQLKTSDKYLQFTGWKLSLHSRSAEFSGLVLKIHDACPSNLPLPVHMSHFEDYDSKEKANYFSNMNREGRHWQGFELVGYLQSVLSQMLERQTTIYEGAKDEHSSKTMILLRIRQASSVTNWYFQQDICNIAALKNTLGAATRPDQQHFKHPSTKSSSDFDV